jgi:hypothetical protein
MAMTMERRGAGPRVERALRVSEVQQSFRDRVLDRLRKFLDDHAMRATGLSGPRNRPRGS